MGGLIRNVLPGEPARLPGNASLNARVLLSSSRVMRTGEPSSEVPTSVGYGANLNGITALLAMLNSCSPGISVVNIDNGFSAGYAACRVISEINRRRVSVETG